MVLNRIAAALTRTLDLREILRTALQETVSVTGADGGAVYLIDPGGQTCTTTVHQGLAEDVAEELTAFKLGQGLSGLAAELSEPLLLADLAADPRRISAAAVGAGLRSYVCIPVTYKGQLRALLALISRQPDYFQPSQVDLLVNAANQLAVAIDNAQLFDEADARRRYLEAMQQINATLRSTAPLTEVLDTVAVRACAALDYVGALILVPDNSGQRLVMGGAAGGRFLKAARRLTGLDMGVFSLPVSVEANPMVEAYREGRMVILSHEPERVLPGVEPAVPIPVARLINRAMGAQSGACVPLPADGHVAGVLFVISARDRIACEEQAMLLGLADQAGLAIENSKLFAEIRAARGRMQALSRRLVQVQEEERLHIARELHDEIGQQMTGLKIMLEMAAPTSPSETRGRLEEAQALVHTLMNSVRELSLDLRPAMLDDLGLLPALAWHIDRYGSQTGLQVSFHHRGLKERRFATEAETAAYRIVQEALTNVVRHAGVPEASVRIDVDANLMHLHVRDEGQGFDPVAVLATAETSGLAGMRERAAALGGSLDVGSAPHAGTSVRATLPLEVATLRPKEHVV
jgi:signal transduction histidine kinase